MTNDTIAAIATPVGAGAIGIVRVSGGETLSVLRSVFKRADGGNEYVPRMMYFGFAEDNHERIDEALAVFFRAPKSYTAEDSAEIFCHGGAVTLRRVLEAVLSAGARAAQPGEFTRRAFENGRIDLTRAEAALSLIEAKSEAAARASVAALAGGAARFITRAKDELTTMLAAIEAVIDFPDEVDETLTRTKLNVGLVSLVSLLHSASDETVRRRALDGVSVVLAGAPNAGKSSLLNRILNEERALVHHVPGTTRDTIEGTLEIHGTRVFVCDTAGLRETGDEVERMGIERAREAIARADLVFFVLDASRAVSSEELAYAREIDPAKLCFALNKSDLINARDNNILKDEFPRAQLLNTSARTGEGLDALVERISALVASLDGGDALLLNARQTNLARDAAVILTEAITNLEGGDPIDPLSTDLEAALRLLCELDGTDASEAVIEDIFKNFCVGK